MGFADLLEHVGGTGRLQARWVLLLALPVLLMASHNLLQNFSAADAHHRCRLWWEVNATGHRPPWHLLDPHHLIHPFEELLEPPPRSPDHPQEHLDHPKNPLDHPKEPLDHPKNPLDYSRNPLDHPKDLLDHPQEPLDHPRDPLEHPNDPLDHPKNPLDHSRNPLDHPKDALDHPKDLLDHPQDPLDHPKNPLDHSRNPLDHSKDALDHPKDLLDHSQDPLDHPKDPLDHSRNPLDHPKEPLAHPKDLLDHPKDPLDHPKNPLDHSRNPLDHPKDPLDHPKDPLDHPNDPLSAPQDLLRVWVPRGERCRRFVAPQWWLLGANASAANGTRGQTEPCGDGWVYDRSVFSSTIVTEWDLVCSSRGLKQLAQSLYMAGVLVGGIVFGGLADRFGRRALLIWCYLQLGAMGTAASLSPTFGSYCLFRLLSGAAFSGIVLNSVSLSLEWMPTRARALVGTFMGYCYTAGQFLLAGAAYALPDWRWLQLAVSLPFFLFFLYSWWLPESARWLVMVGRSRQALGELRRVAKANGRQEEGDKLDMETLRSYMEKEMSAPRGHHTVLDLVRTPVVRRISCCLCFVWFSTSFAYYGLAMDLQNFDVNIYIIQLIFGAVDIPAKLVSILTITFVGRRFTQSLALLLAGLAILANVLVPRDLRVLRTALAVLGKGCLAASFNCVFLYTGELYPTVIRQTGMGLANTMSRLGSITAPLVKMAGEGAPVLPVVVYGAAPVVAGLAAAFLPETRDTALPETVEEVERRAKSQQDEAPHLQVPLQPTPPAGTPGPG